MKRVLMIVAVFLFMTQLPGFAEETSTYVNTASHLSTKTKESLTHSHEYVDTDTQRSGDREDFDYGAYLDFEYEVNDLVNVGLKNSYEFQRKEFTTLAGVTLKFGGNKEKKDSWQ